MTVHKNVECALWELVALQAAVGLRNVVQCLGAFLSGSITDGTRKLVIITECVSPQVLLAGHKPTTTLSNAVDCMCWFSSQLHSSNACIMLLPHPCALTILIIGAECYA